MKLSVVPNIGVSSLIYTGIGVRKDPYKILRFMPLLAKLLRSGYASGSDIAFGSSAGDIREIYLPFKGFNGSASPYYTISSKAYKIASMVHPNWDACKGVVVKFHARDVHQLLGKDICSSRPSGCVICWTVGEKLVGGTLTALRLANILKIPVLNLSDPVIYEETKRYMGVNL